MVGWVVGICEGLPEEDALRAAPLGGDGLRRLEDGWGVGEEAAVPEVGRAAFEDVDCLRGSCGAGSAGALEVEAEGAAGLVFAVDADEVLWMNLGDDGFSELRGGEDRGEGLEAEVRGEQKAEGSGGEGDVGSVGPGFAPQDEREQWAEEEAERGEGEGEAEETEGAGVEVEEVTHAERVVAGVLLEEFGEVGVGCGGFGVEQEDEVRGGEEGSEDEEDEGDAERGQPTLHPSGQRTPVGDRGLPHDKTARRGWGTRTGGELAVVGEPAGDEDGDGGECGEDVVLLARGEREEEKDEGGPDEE